MKPTGIRRTNTGAWSAVVNGQSAGVFTGPGAKANAIRAAGTNAEVPAPQLSYPEGREPVDSEAELRAAAEELSIDLSGVRSNA